MSHPFPKHDLYDPETEPSRHDAERTVAENQRAADRFARGDATAMPAAAISAQTGAVR